ncbi:MAG: class I SAM-dependent methyltransferase [Verrucomicrobiaceae bacterium]|nr:MAG: class I SAM-dependent methyltransferase [Verrucomicrobiaceae bacterium]
MKESIKRLLVKTGIGKNLIRRYRYWIQREHFGRFRSSEEIFTAYYKENEWLDPESLSGPGSTAEYTANIRRGLPGLFQQLGVASMLDAPCGDYNWFRLIDRSNGPDYTGGDIVPPLIEANQAKHADEKTRFITLDITQSKLPSVDLWLCRDCLFHLSEDLVFQALENFVRSDIKWLLTSTHPKGDLNTDIPTGSFRLLNLQIPPYNLPSPAESMEDWIDPHPYRHLSLWSREDVQAALKRRA